MTVNRFVIDAEMDVITCPNCRVCVGVGRCCRCPMRTQGPATEGILTKIVRDVPVNK